MGTEAAKSTRRTRADSTRNRERLVEAATQVFSAGGRQAKLDAVAREAGVGIGTLYRHFPTREALFEAVYRRRSTSWWRLPNGSPGILRRWTRFANGCTPTPA